MIDQGRISLYSPCRLQTPGLSDSVVLAFMYTCVLLFGFLIVIIITVIYMYECVRARTSPQRPEEGFGSTGAGVMGGCEAFNMGAGN